MAQILKDATDKKAGASLRSPDAAANTTGLATSAAAVAASKRRREGGLRQEDDLVGPRAGGEEDEGLRHTLGIGFTPFRSG